MHIWTHRDYGSSHMPFTGLGSMKSQHWEAKGVWAHIPHSGLSPLDSFSQMNNWFSPRKSTCITKPLLKLGPMPSSDDQHKTNSKAFLEVFCLTMLCQNFPKHPHKPFVDLLWFLVLHFLMGFICVGMWSLHHVSVSWAFPLVLFFCLFGPILVCFSFI